MKMEKVKSKKTMEQHLATLKNGEKCERLIFVLPWE